MLRAHSLVLASILASSCTLTCTLTLQAQRLEDPAPRLQANADIATLPEAPSSLLAQQSSSSSQTPTPAITAPDAPQTADPAHPNETEAQRKLREQHEEAEREVKQQEKQRIGSVIPDFNVVLNGQAVPLSGKQKMDIAFHTSIDPYTFGLAALVGGGYGEVEDSHTGYGHGPAGYFKRFGAAYVDAFDGIIIGNGLLPVILHQDPRYYRKIHGTILSRIIYSAESTFICRGDNGKLQANVSNVLGNFIAGGISNAYYPSDERGVTLTVENASIQTVEGMVGAQLLEFSPDVTDYIHRRREHHRLVKAQQAAAAAGQPIPDSLPPATRVTPKHKTPPPPPAPSPSSSQ
jgi:hypothetical protein